MALGSTAPAVSWPQLSPRTGFVFPAIKMYQYAICEVTYRVQSFNGGQQVGEYEMSQRLSRRTILRLGFASTTALCSGTLVAVSQTATLSDIGAAISGIDPATIYIARENVTMDTKMPTATAVAVVGDRILGVGDLRVLEEKLGAQPYVIDRTFSDKVILPGLIEQHAPPVLAALTISSEILAI